MADLATLAQVKQGLRIDVTNTDDDALLNLLIKAASERIVGYIKTEIPDPVPNAVAVATIILVGYLYQNTESDPDKAFDLGTLPYPVTSLIYHLRDPALA
ncbi:head-tail connector protein [Phyllobacterium lublinensis]|uniref:head-tail connector protein n=1 Tax=Phyllobacterium lublinensis TaxID=2875708 RepID=UPI001CC9DF27|nr:head-tail connector protein [Phyllobacterium sp. 2063]MBZ9653540.1 head-tail connector protein [Phyllobacterium sp. 2063]